ncbi:GTPase [Inhella gelatinilytica]|uniref:50S ribosome-binding GTPase n=1 Tax=Inhella gelatinilytica TaxID=2795030 RepID=A0A931J0K5_9BURK|nr:GTPase [Inhella gelatinilytica]MBH9553963.1 50S ribosome-binding GTPase [Inhella gelatinilytica]
MFSFLNGWAQRWNWAKDGEPKPALDESQIREAALASAPVVWLLGKTGSGKSSVVEALTQADAATVGNGFAPCTQTAQVFDFPTERPVLRFLDTRGLGEAGYDPAQDMAVNKDRAHLVIATMRVSDMNQSELIQSLRAIRESHPEWPIIVLHTCLHELYAGVGADHPVPSIDFSDVDSPVPDAYAGLQRAVRHQQALFSGLKGVAPRFAAIDFTRPEDGYAPVQYGREYLHGAILDEAPTAMFNIARSFFADQEATGSAGVDREVNRLILYYAGAAASVGAIPLVGVVSIPGVSIAMLWHLARVHQVEWSNKDMASLIGMFGGAVAVREGSMLLLRQFTKLGPWLIPIAAAQDYAVAFALGKAACVYMRSRRSRAEVNAEEVKAAFMAGLKEAVRMSAAKGDSK